MSFTTAKEFDQAYKIVQKTFSTNKTKPKEWRNRQLKRTWWMIEENKDRIVEALYTDLHRHSQETILSDITMIQSDILQSIQNLEKWMSDEKPTKWDLVNFMGGTTIRKEPKGVVLIISAWNFPFLLLLQPMVAAISAGCAMILKPSDMALASQELLMEIIPRYLDGDAIRCVTAGPKEMEYILERRFDHIFYTGSGNVGRIVYTAAAKNLTPVTMELGGQGPAIVTSAADIELSAKHIAATKFQNAGQICLNVNHIIADPKIHDALVTAMTRHFDTFMGGKAEHYTHIINDRSFDRLDRLLGETSGKIVYGGQRDRSTRFFAPTIVTDVKPDDSLLSEELFGPILPVMEGDLNTAIEFTCSTGQPLALYAFTKNSKEKKRILDETQSGGVTFNDCLLHIVARDAPFGGTGTSGFGHYHGPYGFREFSHLRPYTNTLPAWMESLMDARYPPYSTKKIQKLSPPVKVSFDRYGNDVGTRRWSKWVLGLGAMVVSVAMVASDRVAGLKRQWL